MERKSNDDVVSRLLGYCMQGREKAEEMFNTLIAGRKRHLSLAGEDLELTEEELAEFAERFSAEVEPAFWESKRLKH